MLKKKTFFKLFIHQRIKVSTEILSGTMVFNIDNYKIIMKR